MQTCVVHLTRNSIKFSSWKGRNLIVKALKSIYQPATFDAAADALDTFDLDAPRSRNVDAAQHELGAAEREASRVRLQERLNVVGCDTPHRPVDRSIGIETLSLHDAAARANARARIRLADHHGAKVGDGRDDASDAPLARSSGQSGALSAMDGEVHAYPRTRE